MSIRRGKTAKLPEIIIVPNGGPPQLITKQGLRIAARLSRKAGLCHPYEGIEIMGGKEYFKRPEMLYLFTVI